MKRDFFLIVCVPLATACSQAPAPKAEGKPAPAAAVQPSLQPVLQPPPQVVVIPTPLPASTAENRGDIAKHDPNKMLAERVKRALEDESRIHAAAIDVTAAGGTVTLWGTAATDDERARATRVAARIAGVKWVNNKLVIAAGS
jgi:PBP1b-binding outer membrane lipoprotein LpoB